MSLQEVPQDKKAIRSLVNEIYDITVAEARERVWAHRFTKDLESGKLPIEVIRGLILNLSTWAMEINASARKKFGHNSDFYARFPDLEELLADKAADEFTTPGPGGHQPTVYRLGQALGLDREQMIHYHLIPATRGYLDSIVWLFETGRPGGISITEEWYADWAKSWSKALQKLYGLTKEDVFYWDLHAEADSLDEHEATTVEKGVMGHGMSNRYLSWRVLQEGRGVTPDLRDRWMKSAHASVDQFLIWVESVYDAFDPRLPGRPLFDGGSRGAGAKPSDARGKVDAFLARGAELAEKHIMSHPFVTALRDGKLSRDAVTRFHEQWSKVVRRITASYVGQYHNFIHVYKLHRDLEAQVTLRIGNEVEYPVGAGRPRAMDRLLTALGTSPQQALKAGMFIETDFFVSFLGRLYLQGTLGETQGLQLGNVIAPFARLMKESLVKHYGVKEEDCLYWDTCAEHDRAKEGGGALGTVAENRFALATMYERGLVTERPGWGVDYVGDTSVYLWEMFLTGCQRRLT